jgi:hypothetical protein
VVPPHQFLYPEEARKELEARARVHTV